MISRFNAMLGGKDLLAQVPELRVLDIRYTPATIANSVYQTGYTSHAYITNRKYNGAGVTIDVEIHEYDPAVRNEVCQRFMAWAMRGGVLKTSDRPGQQLNVVCSNAPAIASALKWTDRVSVIFSAIENPFWEEEEVQKVTVTNSASLGVKGCVDNARVTATVTSGNSTNTGTAITNLTIKCRDTKITLTGINVARKKQIIIDYDKYGFLRIKDSDGNDLMKYRTGSDELLLPCGKTSTVEVSANTAVTCVLEVRGYWL